MINLITQDGGYEHDDRKGRATVSDVNHALRKLICHEHLGSVALSRLATGAGGLAREEVRPRIDKQLRAVAADVLLYRESPAAKAASARR